MMKRVGDDPEVSLSALSLAGVTIAERQLDLALALGCERVVCIAQGLDKGVLALQHRAETAGAKFNAIAGPRALLGLVNATDELVVIAEGLLPDSRIAHDMFASGPGVLVLPVEAGIAAGFERIDLNHAWAGVLAMPGRLVERLAQLPPDCDAVSSLLRIALQGHVPERPLPEAILSERRWALVETAGQVGEIEPEWFRRHGAEPSLFAPGRTIAGAAARSFASSLLERGWGGRALGAAGIALALIGLAAAIFAYPVPGIALCGMGWLVGESGRILEQIASAGLGGHAPLPQGERVEGLVMDACLLGALLVALAGSWPDRLFAPAILLALIHLCDRLLRQRWAPLLQDRLLLALFLALGAGLGLLLPFIQAACAALLVLLLGLIGRESRLTQT